jgi:rhodanese-related sulfurtransferase
MCNSGKRAEALANLLETEFNQPNLVVLEGGIAAWIEQFGQN